MIAWKAWACVLELGEDATLADCLRHLAPVYELPADIRAAVEASEGLNQELLLRHLPSVEECLATVNLQGKWDAEFLRLVPAPVVESIEYTADALSRARPEPVIEQEIVQRLHKDIRTLFDEVAQANLKSDLRQSLLYHLQAMDDALRQVKTQGVPVFLHAVEGAVGAELIRIGHGEAPPDTGPRRKFWDLVARAAVVAGLVNQVLALPPAVEKVVGGAEHQPPSIVVRVNDVEGDVGVEIDLADEPDT